MSCLDRQFPGVCELPLEMFADSRKEISDPEWLGHRLPSSTQRYAKITPTKLTKSYSDAGYFGRNLRAIEVLIDQERVRNGVGASIQVAPAFCGHYFRVAENPPRISVFASQTFCRDSKRGR
jgi:hypothetical protein